MFGSLAPGSGSRRDKYIIIVMYLNILDPQLFDPVTVSLKRHQVNMFHRYLVSLQKAGRLFVG